MTVTRLNSDDSIVEVTSYKYDLQNRLVGVYSDNNTTKTPGVFTDDTLVTGYEYNNAGIRVRKIDYASSETTIYLIDSANHTGYAQVFEETIYSGTSIDPETDTPSSRIQYTIGDDVISQNTSTYDSGWTAGTTKFLLYDGHGSTRQLINNGAGYMSVSETFAYDAYGVATGFDPSNAGTNLLYTGEQFDSSLDQYYLRARYYDPSNGRFNRVDPYAGNMQDPQSLHKYTYCNNNPVNGIDPSGMMNLTSLSVGMMIAGTIVSVVGIGMIIHGNTTDDDFLTTIGMETLIVGLALIAGGAGVVFGALSAVEAVVLQVIVSLITIGVNHGGAIMSRVIRKNFSAQNMIRNLSINDIAIPSHGILIFENRGNNINLVKLLDDGDFEWLDTPVDYMEGDRVLEYWIGSNGTNFRYEVKDVVEMNATNQPVFEMITSEEEGDINVIGITYSGFNWARIPKKNK